MFLIMLSIRQHSTYFRPMHFLATLKTLEKQEFAHGNCSWELFLGVCKHVFVNWVDIHYDKHKVSHIETKLSYLESNLFLYCAIDMKECPKHSNENQDTCNMDDRIFKNTDQKLFPNRRNGNH